MGLSRNIVPDPEKAPLIKRVFEEFTSGNYSLSNMVEKAEGWGLKSVFGKKIYKNSMHILLQRTAYYGVYKHGGEYHQGNYETLISKALFDKVQKVLKIRSKPRKKDWVHTYKGMMRCNCGCAITATTKQKYYKGTDRHASYTYYHCTKRRAYCSQEPVTNIELEKMFYDMVSNISIDREVWELGVKLLRKKYEAETEQQDKIRQGWQRQYNQVSKKLGELLDLRLEGEIDSEEYIEAKKGFLDNKKQLKEKLDDEHLGSLQWLELAEKFFNNCFQAKEIMESNDLKAKRRLIRDVGSNLYLNNKKLEFSLKEPYDVLLKPSMRADVQAREDSNPEPTA